VVVLAAAAAAVVVVVVVAAPAQHELCNGGLVLALATCEPPGAALGRDHQVH
jgi:hypothetical protein